MKKPIYHVGLLVKGQTAVFQYRKDKDTLNCEILHYFGERQTTKTDVKAYLVHCQQDVLRALNGMWPGRNFTRVVID